MTYNSLLKDFKAVAMTALIVSAGMLTACSGEKAADDIPTREITLRAEGLTADMVRNSVVPILEKRLKNLGLTSPAVSASDSEPGIITAQVPADMTDADVEATLCPAGRLEFYETTPLDDIPLQAALARANAYFGDALTSRLIPPSTSSSSPVVGYVKPSDCDTVMAMLTSEHTALPLNVKLLPSTSPAFDGYNEIVALRLNYNPADNSATPAMEVTQLKACRPELTVLSNHPVVSIEMEGDDVGRWRELTRRNIGRPIAIVIDGKIYSFPTVHGPIDGGRSQITGNFTEAEAARFAACICAGPLPSPLTVVTEN